MRHAYFTGKKSFFDFGLFRWLRARAIAIQQAGRISWCTFFQVGKIEIAKCEKIEFFKFYFLVAPMSVGAENQATETSRRADPIFDGLDAQRGQERP